MAKGIIKVEDKVFRFIPGLETVNRTNPETEQTESISVYEALKDKKFIARLINKKSPFLQEITPEEAAAAETKDSAKIEALENEVEELKKQIAPNIETIQNQKKLIEDLENEVDDLKKQLEAGKVIAQDKSIEAEQSTANIVENNTASE